MPLAGFGPPEMDAHDNCGNGNLPWRRWTAHLEELGTGQRPIGLGKQGYASHSVLVSCEEFLRPVMRGQERRHEHDDGSDWDPDEDGQLIR